MPPEDWIVPAWVDPVPVRALMSTRRGGADGGENDLRGDSEASRANRTALGQRLGAAPWWLRQEHGVAVQVIGQVPLDAADAAVSVDRAHACVVLVADCLPLLLACDGGQAVAAAHAGWRGLAAGVIEATIVALCSAAGSRPQQLQAWLGPCIGPRRFEVGADVLQAFGVAPGLADDRLFRRHDRADGSVRWLADLAGLARERLQRAGVHRISGGHWCTAEDASAFFSFRRDGSRARLAAAIAPGI